MARQLYKENGSKRETARMMNLPRTTVQHWLSKPDEFELPDLPEESVTVEELLERRKRQFTQKRVYEDAHKLIPIKVKIDGPIGILHFGDPHVDDDGTDIDALERHTDIINNTPGMFGANVGDTTNNWCGRLARLYGEQSTSAKEAWQLAEWFVNRVRWLYAIGGNHDLWSGSGDPMQWIMKQQNGLYKSSEVRLNLEFPNGRDVRINARHDFSGNSMYNPAHGAMKAILFGERDHISICGHKHVSGYGVLKDPNTGTICHAIQVASYKVFDRYAKERGFRDQHISPCAVTVINPEADEAGLVHVFWDAEEAAEYLTWLRSRK
jgi:hypothetical protein